MRRKVARWTAIALTITGLAIAGSKPKIAKDLEKVGKNEVVDVIVQFDKSLDSDSLAKARTRVVVKARQDGGIKKRDLDLVASTVVQIKAKHIDKLAGDPDISYISPNRAVHPSLDHAIPSIGADLAHQYGWSGAGVGVAVVEERREIVPEFQPDLVSHSAFQCRCEPDRTVDDLCARATVVSDGARGVYTIA